MGWMDLNEYFLIDDAVGDRLDDLRRTTGWQAWALIADIDTHVDSHAPASAVMSACRGDRFLSGFEGLNLSQIQSRFTELVRHVARWRQRAGRLDEFLKEILRDPGGGSAEPPESQAGDSAGVRSPSRRRNLP